MKNNLFFLKESLPFWKNLNKNEQNMILHTVIEKSFSKNTILSGNNNECTGFLIVMCGQLRIYSNSSDGKEITLYRLLDFDSCIFSASCMLKNINFDISISFEKDSDILIIPSDIFNKLSEDNVYVKSFVLDLVSSRFSDVMWIFEQYVFSNMAQRLAATLIEQSSLNNSQTLEITHDYIARELGTAREVITRLLKQFQDDNLVKLSRNKLEILNLDGLQNKL